MIDTEIIQRAITLVREGKQDEAERLYQELLKENPDDGVLLSVTGLFYVTKGEYEKSVTYLKRACEIQETLGTLSALGIAYYEMKNYEEAIAVLERALEYGDGVDIYNKLILSLFEAKKYKKANEYTKKMEDLYPDNPKTIANKVKAMTQSGKLLEAEKVCVEYLRQNPDSGSLWFHLGLLKELIYSDDKKAIECYKISGEKGNAGAEYNIAVCYHKLGDYKNAEEYYKKFLKQFPQDIQAKASLGMCYLSQQKFAEGYKLFYERKKDSHVKMSENLWKPDMSLDDKLIIICDQGFGDQIQFIRYLPFLKGKKVAVAVPESLKGLFEANYQDCEFISYSEVDPKVQAVRITDLAYALNLDFNNIPFSAGYLKAIPSDIKSKKLKVGLCWEAGASGIRGMINRTIHVRCFEPLINKEDIQVYSFQYDDTLNGNDKYPSMINLAKDFRSFSDTASALKSMDIVVTVDTCIAHLAGALGVKTFLLLPYAPDWRWFGCCGDKSDYKENTPWYDSVKLFRQKDSISWEEPINNVIHDINAIISSHNI